MQKKIQKTIPRLNSGGCIYFANYFSKALDRLNIPNQVYFVYKKGEDSLSLKNFCGVTHVVVYIKGIGFVDGYRTYTDMKQLKEYYFNLFNVKKVRINLDKIVDRKYWNPKYNTDYNTKLSKIIATQWK